MNAVDRETSSPGINLPGGVASSMIFGPTTPQTSSYEKIMAQLNQHKLVPTNEIATALCKAQAAMQGAKKDTANPFHKSKYADLASVWEAIREPLTANGLSVCQLVEDSAPGTVRLTTILMHTSGQTLTSTFSMPVKDSTNPQAVGSALTYARRYALSAMVGVAPEDDDGNSATNLGKKQAPVAVVGADYIKALEERFKDASTKDQKKHVALEVKSSLIPQELKTKMLGEMSKVINAMKG